MTAVAGIVLAGGRSARMGTAKAALEWHGSTLLRRVVGIVARAVEGPVVVVRAPDQSLPPLPSAIEVLEDPVEGQGPLAGIAAGLAACAGRASVVFVCATDLPLLTHTCVLTIVAALSPDDEIAVPQGDGRDHPLAAAYRTAVAPRAQALLAAGERRATALLDASRTKRLPASTALRSCLTNLNTAEEYRAARALPVPEVTVTAAGRSRTVRAATLAMCGEPLDEEGRVELNGLLVPTDPEIPLVAGDRVAVTRVRRRRPSVG